MKTLAANTAQKMMFSIKDFFCKCDQTRSLLRIWSHLLKKSLMENLTFCAVKLLMLRPKEKKRKILLFLEKRVTRKFFTRAAANLIFLISFIEFFK